MLCRGNGERKGASGDVAERRRANGRVDRLEHRQGDDGIRKKSGAPARLIRFHDWGSDAFTGINGRPSNLGGLLLRTPGFPTLSDAICCSGWICSLSVPKYTRAGRVLAGGLGWS